MPQAVSSPKKNNKSLTTRKRLFLNCKALPKSGIYFVKERLGKVKPVKSKLVLVISFPRSGTHALGSLVSQENIGFRYHGELFAFNHWSSVIERLNRYYPFFSFRFYLNFKTQRQKWRTYRFESSSLSATRTMRAMKKYPTVSVVLSTVRPEDLTSILSQIKLQTLKNEDLKSLEFPEKMLLSDSTSYSHLNAFG